MIKRITSRVLAKGSNLPDSYAKTSIQSAMESVLDNIFISEVEEYVNFRHGYEDAQIPASGLSAPSSESVAKYQSMLVRQLSEQFGSEARIHHTFSEPRLNERFAQIEIHIRRAIKVPSPSVGEALSAGVIPKPIGAFSPQANILFDPELSRVAVAKPWTQVAWTIEQAYADARGISEEVLRSGV